MSTGLNYDMLKRFKGGSKNLRSFTTGTAFNLAPDVAKAHLEALEAAGLIKASANTYAITQSGLTALDNYRQASADRAQERRNPGPYVPPAWNVRDGGNDHFNYSSLGMGPQIQVATPFLGVSEGQA